MLCPFFKSEAHYGKKEFDSEGEEAAESVDKLRAKVESTGYRVVTARGDHAGT